ncbi:NUDIX hydrolase [Alkalibacillus aidingensis]|uniref:NUDIX hydrolase n=1 Tax=Alkalibacillus aidingensis TaxID=2747607 RepID=UPI001660B0A0|nr:NUDIX domain-containing protein [Alkalibacillus aidingensis]
MKLKQFAAAYLFNEDEEVLFLQKKEDASFLSGMLVPVGGHMKEGEMNAPESACIREIEEESGLDNDDYHNLQLRYILYRMKGVEEIRIQYIFFGEMSKESDLVASEEGELKWIPYRDIPNEDVTQTNKEIAQHYETTGRFNDHVYVGVMKSDNGEPGITWALLEDWELYEGKPF